MKKKKPIALVMTDSHKHRENIRQVEDIEEQAIALCKAHGIDRLFHGGDMVTARQAQPLSVLSSILRFRDRLLSEGIRIDIIEGNHDKTDLEDTEGYISIFSTDTFRVHGTASSHHFPGTDVVLHMLPYFPETGTYVERLTALTDSLDLSRYNILLTHVGINGGLAHESASTNKEVPAECFAGFDKVLVGHYHNRCRVEAENEIHYVGSTHPQNFGEDNEKGFTLIYSDGSHEYVRARFTEYHTLTLDVAEADLKFLKNLKKRIDQTGDRVRVVLTGDESRLRAVDKRAFADAGVSKLKLLEDTVDFDGSGEGTPQAAYHNFTKQDIIKEYKVFSLANELSPELGLEYLEEIRG